MDSDIKKDLEEILKETAESAHSVPVSSIPDIALYMDQVTTFMSRELDATKRYESDKILTKTMINNYTKNGLLPPPDKKKYSKEHMLLLLLLYSFKDFLSIGDIKTALSPLLEICSREESPADLSEVYTRLNAAEDLRKEEISKDILDAFKNAENAFADAPEADREVLTAFALIHSLSFGISFRKRIVEKLIDVLQEKKLAEEKAAEAADKGKKADGRKTDKK